MSLTVVAVRQRVAAAIATAMSAANWRETTGTVDTFGAGDGENRLHLGYAVGSPSTSFKAGRQKRSEGMLVETTVRVRWAYSLGALAQLADYDVALAAEAAIIVGVHAKAQSTDLHLTFVSATREVDDQGWMMGDITWTADHLLALQ